MATNIDFRHVDKDVTLTLELRPIVGSGISPLNPTSTATAVIDYTKDAYDYRCSISEDVPAGWYVAEWFEEGITVGRLKVGRGSVYCTTSNTGTYRVGVEVPAHVKQWAGGVPEPLVNGLVRSSVSAVQGDTSLATRLNTWLTEIESLAEWFRVLVREDKDDSTVLALLNANGGSFLPSLHALQAIRNKFPTNFELLEIDAEGRTTALVISDPGTDLVTLRWVNQSTGTPVADADAWITVDAAGTSVVAGTKQTDSNGYVEFLLTYGNTYYAWFQKDGVEPLWGRQFTAGP